MANVTDVQCKQRHNWIWVIGSGAVFLLVVGIGWAHAASWMALNNAASAMKATHDAEVLVAEFHGQQTQFNSNTTAMLKTIETKVDAIWRKNGGGK